MDTKKVALILTSLGAIAGIAAGLIAGTTHFDGTTLAALVGAVSPIVSIFTAKSAVDEHIEEHH